MMDFERHDLDATENAGQQLTGLTYTAQPVAAPSFGGSIRRSRLILTLLTIMAVGVMLAASSPWWFAPAQHFWVSVFPPPLYRGTLVFVQSDDGLLKALRASDGSVVWTREGATQSTNFIHMGDMLISSMHSGTTGVLVGLRAIDGKVLWQMQNPANYNAPILLDDGVHAFAWFPSDGISGALFERIDPRAGKVIWSKTTNNFSFFSPLSSTSTLVACDQEPDPGDTNQTVDLTAIDINTDKQLWQSLPITLSGNQTANCSVTSQQVLLDVGGPISSTLLSYDLETGLQQWAINFVGTLTANDDMTAYTTTWGIDTTSSQPDSLTALDMMTGQPRWQIAGQYTALLLVPPAASSSTLLTKTPTGIAEIDANSGNVIWRFDPAGDDVQNWQATYGEKGVLYYLDSSIIYALKAATGDVIWTYRVPPNYQPGGYTVYQNNSIYLQIQNTLIELDASSGRPRWQMSHITQFQP